MSDIHDLKDYRQSKIITKDLDAIRLLIRSSYREFSKYKKYLPVKNILNELLGAEVVLKQFHSKHSEILKRKGKI
jgi:hypothetical protein